MKFILVLVSLLAVSLAQTTANLPTNAEIDEMLRNREEVIKVVDCVIDFRPYECDPRLQKAAEKGQEFFRFNMECEGCDPVEEQFVIKFLKKLQNKYSREYQRILRTFAK